LNASVSALEVVVEYDVMTSISYRMCLGLVAVCFGRCCRLKQRISKRFNLARYYFNNSIFLPRDAMRMHGTGRRS